MPLHCYRVMPALAAAVSAVHRPGEWLLALRARSEASAIELYLSAELCAALGSQLRQAAKAFSGALFDLSGSYHAAFVNGLVWNLLNVAIAGFLLRRAGPRTGRPAVAAAAG